MEERENGLEEAACSGRKLDGAHEETKEHNLHAGTK